MHSLLNHLPRLCVSFWCLLRLKHIRKGKGKTTNKMEMEMEMENGKWTKKDNGKWKMEKEKENHQRRKNNGKLKKERTCSFFCWSIIRISLALGDDAGFVSSSIRFVPLNLLLLRVPQVKSP